jgi:hypothetical protein
MSVEKVSEDPEYRYFILIVLDKFEFNNQHHHEEKYK